VTLVEREHCVIALLPYPQRSSLHCDAHVPVEQARQKEQEVFVLSERIPHEQHPRTVSQPGPQSNHFSGEPPRRWLYTFEDTQSLRALLLVLWGKEQDKQHG